MEGTVVKIIKKYLEWEKVKKQQGYSDDLRLEYDNDALYYLNEGYSREKALQADTIISFWTIYKTLLKKETGWITYKTTKSLENLLEQIHSKRENDYTDKIVKLNKRIEDFAQVIYTKGNYMLLPERRMNNARYQECEDRIDLTLYYSFSGGKLSTYFKNDEKLKEWIIEEKLDVLFKDCDIKKENIHWLVKNQKKITEMTVEEIYIYIDSSKSFIEKRSKCV